MEQIKHFLKTLFDFSFTDCITLDVVKILYGLGIFIAGVGTLTLMFRGVLFFILSPLVFIFYTMLIRVGLEIVLKIFQIAENIDKVVEK